MKFLEGRGSAARMSVDESTEEGQDDLARRKEPSRNVEFQGRMEDNRPGIFKAVRRLSRQGVLEYLVCQTLSSPSQLYPLAYHSMSTLLKDPFLYLNVEFCQWWLPSKNSSPLLLNLRQQTVVRQCHSSVNYIPSVVLLLISPQGREQCLPFSGPGLKTLCWSTDWGQPRFDNVGYSEAMIFKVLSFCTAQRIEVLYWPGSFTSGFQVIQVPLPNICFLAEWEGTLSPDKKIHIAMLSIA